LTIRFDRPLKPPARVKAVEDSQVALRWLQAEGNILPKNETYLIGEGYTQFEIRPALDLRIIPATDGLAPEDIDFTWEIVAFRENEVQIQLNFTTPEKLSQDPIDTD